MIHLDSWYAQSHPDEDFAETFAVWLTPGADWRARYAGWPALRKLEYMDELMKEIGPRAAAGHRGRHARTSSPRRRRPCASTTGASARTTAWTTRTSTTATCAGCSRTTPPTRTKPTAAAFVSRIRREVRQRVGRWTGVYQYTIDQVLKDIIARCRELNLRVVRPEEETRMEFTTLLTVQTMNYLHSGRHRVAL